MVQQLPKLKNLLSKSLVVFGSTALLVGCATSNVGKYDNRFGGPLNKYLHIAYAELASKEGAEKDFEDQEYFATKALNASKGENVMETPLDARTFTDDNATLAYRARVLVVSMRRRGAFEKFPGPAAKLQVAHDCYLQELEENFQPDDIAACKAELDKQYARLEILLQEPEPPAPEKKAELPPVPGPFNLYFDLDSAELSKKSLAEISRVAKSAMNAQLTQIKIYGNTDTSGKVVYNQSLGLLRANAVRDALIAAGLSGIPMEVYSMGEKQLQVPTADGQKEPLNRRVELVLIR